MNLTGPRAIVGRAVSSREKSASSKIERVLLMIRKLAANTARIIGS